MMQVYTIIFFFRLLKQDMNKIYIITNDNITDNLDTGSSHLSGFGAIYCVMHIYI